MSAANYQRLTDSGPSDSETLQTETDLQAENNPKASKRPASRIKYISYTFVEERLRPEVEMLAYQQQHHHHQQLALRLPVGQSTAQQSARVAFSSTPISKQQQQQYQRLADVDYKFSRQTGEGHQCNHYCAASCTQSQELRGQLVHQQQQTNKLRSGKTIESVFSTDDPVLLRWLQAMRFETELECLTSLQARTLAIDGNPAAALSVRNSQVLVQEIRCESDFILEFIDYLIDSLPISSELLPKFTLEFSDLWTRLVDLTAANCKKQQQQQQTLSQNNHIYYNANQFTGKSNKHLTIINCTPRKTQLSSRTMRPLDKIAAQIRALCIETINSLYEYQSSQSMIDNGLLESSLRRLKELYGKYTEIAIRSECANIVRALNYDFSNDQTLSSASLRPTRPFESSTAQLPLKWALIALWQLTKSDSYICRLLTEKWQTVDMMLANGSSPRRSSPVAKRLDYSTKYDNHQVDAISSDNHSLRSDYQKMYEICQRQHPQTMMSRPNTENCSSSVGALSSALRSKENQPVKEMSTIELLIEIIISQPNKHERLDMVNHICQQAQQQQQSNLIDLDELDQSLSAAIYTSNQYKVAALRILNHLCVNEQAVKTILRCFSTPPPTRGQPVPENKIIRSIFESYQTAQEHIYQNETVFKSFQNRNKKFCSNQQQDLYNRREHDDDSLSDYGSRQTYSKGTTSDPSANYEEGDDVVVKEAIRLIVQLTNAFHRSNQALDYYTLIGRFSINSLVKYLTNIMRGTQNREMLFLSLTALANISFITTDPMNIYGTTKVMLDIFMSSKSRAKDLELRDQAVTILANAADKNLLDVVSNAGLNFLLSCLESCPTRMANYNRQNDKSTARDTIDDQSRRLNIENKPRERRPINLSDDNTVPDILDCSCDQPQQVTCTSLANEDECHSIYGGSLVSGSTHWTTSVQTPTSLCLSRLTADDLAAIERIHQKTAVAFARMSVDSSITMMVLKYDGIKRMIDLCKYGHKRNHSDTVLIACIAALKKMAKVIDRETFRYYNALDLIELELNKALDIYGSQARGRYNQSGNYRTLASDL